jgi:arylsulfatase A-like enzyme
MARRPNILMIMTDNQPAELLGCYGNAEIATPHIDALASESLQFDNAFCVNGMCSPCRASVMTGLMPSQHGIHTWIDDRLRHLWPDDWNPLDAFQTLPALLAAQGYQTALIGKFHIGAPEQPKIGFQHWVTNPHGHVTDFWNGSYIENGKTRHYPGHSVDYFTDQTVAYLENTRRDAPFFAFVPYNAPYGHWPALKGRARNRFRALYDDTAMHSIPREGLHKNAIARFLRKVSDSVGGIDHSSELRIPNDLETLRNYFSEMSMVDDGVGRVLGALKRLNLYDETVIIYTTDHGFSLGHHGIWGHSQATLPAHAHRESFSIPLLMRHGDRFATGRTDQHISQIDLFPTLLELAGIAPDGHNADSAAHSFAPSLATARFERPDEVFLEQEETRAIRTPNWLYQRRFQLAPDPPYGDELYDLASDPHEKVNLVDDPAHAVVAADLIARIEQFFARHSRPEYDLWHGGAPQSNSDKPWLWQQAWGDGWHGQFQDR